MAFEFLNQYLNPLMKGTINSQGAPNEQTGGGKDLSPEQTKAAANRQDQLSQVDENVPADGGQQGQEGMVKPMYDPQQMALDMMRRKPTQFMGGFGGGMGY